MSVVLACGAMALVGCKGGEMQEKPIDVADLDPSVKPGDDFYQYSNGGWIAKAKIPSDRSRYGAFDILAEQTQEKVKDILIRAAEKKGDTTDADWRKIGAFFASGMDTAAIEAAGINPIKGDLELISGITSPEELLREIARERSSGGSDPFYVGVEQDSKNATEMIMSFSQSGLGMPDQSYYLNKDEQSEELRKAYKEMLKTLFVLLGNGEEAATAMTNDVFALETTLAESSLTRLQYRNPHLVYNKMTPAELGKLTPNINWDQYFQNLGVNQPDSVLVDNPKFFTTVSEQLKETPINVWRDYLAVHYVMAYANVLSKPFEEAAFKFYGTTLSGQKEMQPRWKRVARMTQAALGMAVGRFYVAENFSPAAKQRMLELVGNLRKAYGERMANLTWMSEATKAKAKEKLDAIVVKIGYPDKWKDYTDLVVQRDSYAINVRNAKTFNFLYTMSKLGKPVDRGEWFMTPQTVNAYYNPTMNEIVFPAAILQPPFFDMNADDAVNYGAIGVVIGHEITHGFDDQGRQYNKEGNLEDWWTPEDAERFNENAQILVNEFNQFEPIKGHFVNGSLTLGENLADYGGLTISMAAFKNVQAKLAKDGVKEENIDGFTPYQRFFLAYSKVWRNKTTEKELLRRLKEDVHSPGKYRVDGGVYNIGAFYEAFDVSENSPYYRAPEARPSIW